METHVKNTSSLNSKVPLLIVMKPAMLCGSQMRDERRGPDSTPRRRATDPVLRRRSDDEGELAAGAGEGNN